MARRACALLLCAAVLGVAAQPSAAADPAIWQTPSHNIACAVFGSALRCDMRKLGVRPPAKPASCDFDYGNAFGITRDGGGGRRLCVSDAVGGPGTAVVAYGRTWKRGGFTCRVRRSGVRCTNPGGHGFELRIGRQRLF